MSHGLTRRTAAAGLCAGLASAAVARPAGQPPLRLLIPEGSGANLGPIMDSFRRQRRQDFDVVEMPVTDIGTTLLVSDLTGARGFDVALPPTHELPSLVTAGILTPLDTILAEPSQRIGRAIFTDGDSFDGLRYGVQTDGDAYLMFLNRELLADDALREGFADTHGRPFQVPVTWRELDRQARFVSERLGRPGAILLRALGQVEWEFWLRLHAMGIWPLDADFGPQFASDEGIEVLEDMIRVAEFTEVGDLSGRNYQSIWNSFADTGTLATFGWGGTQKAFRLMGAEVAQNVIAAPVPGGDGAGTPASLPYFNWGWTYAVTRAARDPQLALEFIRHAVSPRVSTEAVRAEAGFFDPFREEHFSDSVIQRIYGAQFLDVLKTSLETAMPDLYIANRRAYFETLGSWLLLALEGSVSPKTALSEAADHWRLLAQEDGRELQAARWRRIRAAYPTHIAGRLRDPKP